MNEYKTETEKQPASRGYVVCCALIGGIFLLLPGLVIGMLSLILGLLCIAYGIWRLVGMLRTSFFRIGALIGAAAGMLIGIYIICQPQKIFSLLPMAVGIYFLMDGLERLRCAVSIHRTMHATAANRHEAVAIGRQKRRFYGTCAIGVITMLGGVLLLLNPFGALELTLRVCGGMILLNGIGALGTAHALKSSRRMSAKDSLRRAYNGTYETEFRDITDEEQSGNAGELP